MSVTVTNAPPLAQDDSTATLPDTAVSIPVLVNDADLNADPVTITRIVTPPDPGTVTFTPAGEVIYTPSVEFTGTDSFTYEISDDQGETATAVVTITVDDVTPYAVADQATTPVDIPVIIPVLENDADPNGDPLTVILVSTPINGTAEINTDGTVTYTPALSFFGLDTFVYTLDDGQGQTNTAVVVVRVDDAAPNAVGDGTVTQVNTLVTIDVLANDSDSNAALLTSTDFTQGTNGTVTLNNNETPGNPSDDVLEYVPVEGFSGLDTFTYIIMDPTGNTAIAAVTVFVNAPPVARDDTAVINQDTPVTIPVLANDFDSDGTLDPASVAVVTGPADGTAVVNADGTVTYIPAPTFIGTDTFTYTVSDNQDSSDTATVTITVFSPLIEIRR